MTLFVGSLEFARSLTESQSLSKATGSIANQKLHNPDVRPHLFGEHRVKFMVQALPFKEKSGGIRTLYSHNVQFPHSATGLTQRFFIDMDSVVEILSVLQQVKRELGEKNQLVSDYIIEAVLQETLELDFGHGVTSKTWVFSVLAVNMGRSSGSSRSRSDSRTARKWH